MLFRRLEVLHSDFTVEIAEVVCSGGLLPRSSILDAMAGLADKSLVYAVDGSASNAYRMLAAVREYAAGQLLAAGEEDQARHRHAAWVQAELTRISAWYNTPRAGEALDGWRALANDVDAALRWSIEGDLDGAVAVTRMAQDLWFATGLLSEGVHWSEECLARDIPETTRAELEGKIGYFLAYSGVDGAVGRCRQGYARALTTGDVETISEATRALGVSLMLAGDLAGAEPLLGAEVAGNQLADFNAMGALCYWRGDYLKASHWYRRGIDQATVDGVLHQLAILQMNLAEATLELGDPDQAGRLIDKCALQIRQLSAANLPFLLELTSRVAHAQGRTADARAALLEGIEVARHMGNRRYADGLVAQLDRTADGHGLPAAVPDQGGP